jgi:hypothetical protein
MRREYAIKMFRKHWNWLSENPLCEKEDFPELDFHIENHCYLCEITIGLGRHCSKCAINWGYSGAGLSPCEKGLYKYYSYNHIYRAYPYTRVLPSGLSKIYKRIANLPEA